MRTHLLPPTKSRLGSLVPTNGYRLNEVLIVGRLVGCRHGERLEVRFSREPLGSHVGHPHLHQPEALLPHPLAVSAYPILDCHSKMLHVTSAHVEHRYERLSPPIQAPLHNPNTARTQCSPGLASLGA